MNQPVLRTISHYTSTALPIAVLAAGAGRALRATLLWGTPAADATATVEAVVYLPLWVAAIVLITTHDLNLCEACITGMPLNPAAAAARHAWLLRAGHFLATTRWSLMACAACIGAVSLAGSLLLGGAETQAGLLWDACLVFVPVALVLVALRRHTRFRPWCPGCHRGGGGDDRPDPEEVPDGPDGRTLPAPVR